MPPGQEPRLRSPKEFSTDFSGKQSGNRIGGDSEHAAVYHAITLKRNRCPSAGYKDVIMRPNPHETDTERQERSEPSRTWESPQNVARAEANTLPVPQNSLLDGAVSPGRRPSGTEPETVQNGTVEPMLPAYGDPPTIDRLLTDPLDALDDTSEMEAVDGNTPDIEETDTGRWDDVPTVSGVAVLPELSSPPPIPSTPSTPTAAVSVQMTEQLRSEILNEVRQAVWEQAEAQTLQEHWLPLIERLVELYAELDRAGEAMGETTNANAAHDASAELRRHVLLRLQEIMGRGGVAVHSEISEPFDRTKHETRTGIATPPDGTPIRRFLSPVFIADGRVLRRGRVETAADTAVVEKGRDKQTLTASPKPPLPPIPNVPNTPEEDGDTLDIPPL